MFKVVALVALFAVSINAATTCGITPAGPPIMGMCPGGNTLTTDGTCCDSTKLVTVTNSPPCVDKTKANGVSDCPAMKSYCNDSVYRTLMTQQCPRTCGFCAGGNPPPSTTCVDLINPRTGRSDCPANAGLCNDSVYRDLMKTQCPKTCGYCR